ncbi:hypothetical protein N665_0052s0026 [Sinapis alba]|nr:hypothetical protein N665_0052s0026 [Sinapis alba]
MRSDKGPRRYRQLGRSDLCETLNKMEVDLRDMKPSTRSLTGLNEATKEMRGTIHLPVYAGGIARSVKFSVIKSNSPYNAILRKPWIHSMKAILLTYHQCIKFLDKNGHICTIRGDQRAARDLLVAAVKLQ